MISSNLSGRELNAWSGVSFDCSCGKRHELNTAFYIGEGAENDIVSAVSALAPSCCGVMLLRGEGYDVSDLSRTLRRGGYKVYEREIADDADFVVLEDLNRADDIRAVIGVGGGYIADCAKYVAAYARINCGIVVRVHSSPSFLVPSSALAERGMPRLYKTVTPKVLVCDPSKLPDDCECNAAAFGAIVSRLVALYDWKFASLVRAEPICKEIYDAALGEIDGVLNRLRVCSRRDVCVRRILLESGLRLSALAAMSGSSRLYSGGDTACALALNALRRHEKNELRLQGENEFLFSLILSKIYPELFSARKEGAFFPPPDNNLRLEKMKEYFGAEESVVAPTLSPYIDDDAFKLYDYRIGEYEDELKAELAVLNTRLNGAYKIFRRLYSDDGYFLKSYLDVSEAKLCVALAPEMRSKYTALTHMKNMGLTDGYLI
ncbi:MAG: iron-containing alcohol dehydrogenase [Clostridia bacterium]|nr:iron-containing alcohol dehydrogenase [Clostridia bacterium]